MAGTDPRILTRIGELVEEEKQLRARHRSKPLDGSELRHMEEIEAELDQCWDLLNQRRALSEFGMDPEQASVRDEETVERYQQ
jgi:hypothetical protein